MQARMGQTMAAVLGLTIAAVVTAAEHSITFEQQGDSLRIRADGRPLATYVYRDKEILRPYFKDLCAPGGIQVTRRHPPREGADPVDHATMHPGLWLAFGDLGGADFWRNKADVVHAGFVRAPNVEGDRGTFAVRNDYVAGGVTLCWEVCMYTFQVQRAGYVILWDSTFQSEQSGLCFGDQEEMGLGLRVATPIRVKPYENRSRPGRILNEHGRRDEKETWGEQAAWCDYAGWVDGTFVGITIMSDPGNIAACRWHTRNYGLMVANPFAELAFKKGPVNKTELASGEPFHLRFGILVHATDDEESFDPASAYREYRATTTRK